MRKLEPGQYGALKPGEQSVELRFTNSNGETEAWQLAVSHTDLRRFNKSIVAGYIDDQVDTRLGNQIAIISRMQDHLVFHHRELGELRNERCGWEAANADPS